MRCLKRDKVWRFPLPSFGLGDDLNGLGLGVRMENILLLGIDHVSEGGYQPDLAVAFGDARLPPPLFMSYHQRSHFQEG